MGPVSIAEVLQVAFAGIAFLLAFLAYRLLRKQMDREVPNEAMLLNTRWYMAFSIAMAVIAIGAQLVD